MKSALFLLGFSLMAYAEVYDANHDLPKLKVHYELNQFCEFLIKSTAEIGSSKALPEFMGELMSEQANYDSANKSSIKSYKIKSSGVNSFQQTVKATKSGMSATIVSSCAYTEIKKEQISLECTISDGGGVIEKGSTKIRCSNKSSESKQCVFTTTGKAIKQLWKSPCSLSAGGAAETVQGILRLAQYITHGSVDSSAWTEPGATFYSMAKDYGNLEQRTFLHDQVIK